MRYAILDPNLVIDIPNWIVYVRSMSTSDFRLYILSRTDMDSMNPGKAVAQGAHAANQFVYNHAWRPDRTQAAGIEEWERSAFEETYASYKAREASGDLRPGERPPEPGGFGVTICLGVDEGQLRGAVSMAKLAGFPAGITHDPSYPIRDGQVTHLIPLDTGGYIFGSAEALRPILGQFNLRP